MSKPLPKYAYEDMEPGMALPFGPRTINKEEIIEFASAFDPQPFHLDEEAGKASVLGGLAASGWQTAALIMRILRRLSHQLDLAGRPRRRIHALETSRACGRYAQRRDDHQDKRISKSRPAIGLVTFHHELFNQRGESVCEMQHPCMMLRRDYDTAAGGAS